MIKLLPRGSHVKTFLQIGLLLMLIISIPIFALAKVVPPHTVSGQVTDSKKAPLPGVSVLLKGTNRGVSTDGNGRFVLTDVPDNGVLIFTYTGLAVQEIQVNGRANISISLSENVSALDEVVVVGYGTKQKKDLTGAVSQVKVAQLENENPQSVQDAMRGNVPGVVVTSSPNAKGGGNLQIRGQSSLSAGTSPLIVLDGVIYQGDLSDINPNDIATIDVLKDASSAAVYGAKAASGVVLVTTKKGSGSKPTITFNTNVGLATLAMDEPLYDGPGFVNWRTNVLKSQNVTTAKPYQYDDPRTLPPSVTLAQWFGYDNTPATSDPVDVWLTRLKLLPIERQNYKAGKTTNWYDMMFQKGMRNDHTVSVSGKKEDISYYLSLNYNNNQGYLVGDKFTTYRTRLNVEAKAAKFMTVGINLQIADRDESQVPVTWGQMVNASPYGEVYKADGVTLRDSPNDDVGNNLNPFLDNVYTNRLRKYITLFGSIYAKGNLPWGFSYQTNFTPNYEFYRNFNGTSAKDFRVSARKGVASRQNRTTFNWQMDNLLMWNRTFGNHKIDATVLLNAEKYQQWDETMNNEGFDPNDNLSYNNIGAGIKPTISSNDQKSTGDALMGRLNYSFKDKYLLTASIRRDGYSAFGQGNPRATFPSIALGWVFTKERFASARWLNYGKLRASWGVNGNRDIGRYAALADLTTGKYQYILPSGAIVLVSQLYVNRLQNPGLKWERTASYDLGLDFSILRDRIGGSIDLYRKSTKDLLVNRALPDVTGFQNVIDNIGEVQNRGIEIMLNSVNIKTPNFSWRSTATFTLNKNQIKHLYGPTPDYDATGKVIGESEKDDVANRWFIGHDINSIWDLKVLGVWQQDELTQAAKYGVRPGDFKLEDVNGDGKYSDADRQFLGYRNPKFQWSLRNEFTFFRNFDFSFLIYSNWGMKEEFNQAKNNGGFIDRQNSYLVPYWTPENPINDYARLFSSNGSAGFSAYRQTSFIRLSTVALAYTVPARMLTRLKIQNLKIYVNVNNLAVYQPEWSWWDAEFRVNPPTDRGIIPPPRYYTLGINLTL
ncbi:MAG: SusC/RagA family TonB-linked outer membrane protein [Chitinophagaceae bacterium]|nr:SusC/RagA family TonB-linked outer membrane protein [Chitinophagaceae bacterium]